MVPVADALAKTHENSSLRSSGSSQGTISGNSESEDVVVNEGCTSSSKGYTPCHFILSLLFSSFYCHSICGLHHLS